MCVCNWKLNSQTINKVRNRHFHRQYLMKAPELHKRIPARKSCATDVLCNWETNLGGSFLLTGRSFFPTVGLCCLRSIRSVFSTYGLVFFAYGGNQVWSFLLTVPLRPEIRFGLFCLRFPSVRKLGLVFFAYGSPTVSKKDEP